MAIATPQLSAAILEQIAFKEYELFGGAIKCSLPIDLLDASDIRQVPDTQEVWLSKNSDISYVVEILERVDKDDGIEAAKFHFEALAHDNNATSSTVDAVFPPTSVASGLSPPAQPSCFALAGTQMVPKFNKQQADDVKIFVAVWRVDAKNTDVVLSINVPVTTGSDGNAQGVGELGLAFAQVVWEKARSTFRIDDFGLFA